MPRTVALAPAFCFLLTAAAPAADLPARIDALLADRHRAAGVQPAPRADDAEFLRRVHLDLAGRIPSADEARAFLDNPSPDKRRALVERLLKDPRYADHFTNVWLALLVPEAVADINARLQSAGFDTWLRKQFAENIPYDRMARELLTVPFGTERVRDRRMAARPVPSANPNDPSPQVFYLAKEAKPENLAAATARVFLGVRIECAQCHDHPSASWTRDQFWSYAAFFAGLQRATPDGGGQIREVFDKREMVIPGGGAVVEAAFLDGTEPRWRFNVGPRVTLAEWVTKADNPFFARAAVNRLWAHFFGTGLVDPDDDFRSDNPPSHPELLVELARQFAAHNFDVQYLIRAITATAAYQRTSISQAHGRLSVGSTDPRLFAVMAVKRLTAEQLFDSLAQATGYREPARQPELDALPLQFRSGPRAEFLALFANGPAARTDVQLSIPQALLLMNGQFVTDAAAPPSPLLRTALAKVLLDGLNGRGPDFRWPSPLAAAAGDVRLDTAGRVEALFLATLSRRPTAAEARRLVRYIDGGGPANDTTRALADVFWALLNSAEFGVNH